MCSRDFTFLSSSRRKYFHSKHESPDPSNCEIDFPSACCCCCIFCRFIFFLLSTLISFFPLLTAVSNETALATEVRTIVPFIHPIQSPLLLSYHLSVSAFLSFHSFTPPPPSRPHQASFTNVYDTVIYSRLSTSFVVILKQC